MKRLVLIAGALLYAAYRFFPRKIIRRPVSRTGWFTLFDGNSLVDWENEGNANWTLEGGVVHASTGTGYLVSRNAYVNYELRGEFWIEADSNAGVLVRAFDRRNISAAGAYEVNFNDNHPDPAYGTGAIIGLAQVNVPVNAAGRWNTFEIHAKRAQLTVFINGQQTSSGSDNRYPRGHIALQHHAGVVKFRNIDIRPL